MIDSGDLEGIRNLLVSGELLVRAESSDGKTLFCVYTPAISYNKC